MLRTGHCISWEDIDEPIGGNARDHHWRRPHGVMKMSGFQNLAELVNRNAVLVRRGRYLSVDFLVVDGETPYWISVRDGRIADVVSGQNLMRPWRFAIRATREAWRGFWQPTPSPGFHDIFAMCKDVIAMPRRQGPISDDR